MKILARICKELKAFGSFKSFEYLVKEVVNISRQNEGWLRAPKSASSRIRRSRNLQR